MPSIELDDLIDNIAASALLGIRPNTLEVWRTQGKGPAYLKLGETPFAPIRYQRSVVLAWRERHVYRSTSAHTAAVKQNMSAPATTKGA